MTAGTTRELEAAIEAVRDGLALARRGDGFDQVTAKAGVDIVTAADVAVEDAMRAVLRARCPEIAIVGEERGGSAGAGAYWLIDPICGTRNFASQLGLYATNLALVEGAMPVLGVVGDGSTGRVYAARSGERAFSAGAARSPLQARDGSVIALELAGKPPFDGPPEGLGRFIARLATDGRHYVRLLGSTLPLAKLACGDLAAVVLLGSGVHEPLHTVAGCVLAEAAGAIVTGAGGEPWTLETATLVAAATAELHATLLRHLSDCSLAG